MDSKLLLSMLGILVFLIFAQTGSGADIYLEHVKDEIDVFEGCSYYKINNNLNVKMPSTISTDISIKETKNVVGSIYNGRWEYRVNETYWDSCFVGTHEESYVWGDINESRCLSIGCEYKGKTCTCANTVYDYEPCLKWRWAYKETKDLLTSQLEVSPKSAKMVRYCADIKRESGRLAVDHIPEFNGIEYKEFQWWNTTWQYNHTINLTVDIGSTRMNYTVQVIFHADNQRTNWDINKECYDSNSTPMRFINSSGDGELDFWVENCSRNADNMTVWVLIPSENITTTNQTFMTVMYGNTSEVELKSDGASTFPILYDDIEGTVGNMPTNWVNDGVAVLTVNNTHAVPGHNPFSVKQVASGGWKVTYRTFPQPAYPFVVDYFAYFYNVQSGVPYAYVPGQSGSSLHESCEIRWITGTGTYQYIDNVPAQVDTGIPYVESEWQKIRVIVYGIDNYTFMVNESISFKNMETRETPSTLDAVGTATDVLDRSHHMDLFRVRLYHLPNDEPKFSFGPENSGADTTPPVITFDTQFPADILFNSTGQLWITFNVTDDTEVNESSIAFFHGVNYSYNGDHNFNWSWRYPRSAKQPIGLRADNRNESNWWERVIWKSADNDIWSFSGYDITSDELTNISNTSTLAYMNYTEPIHRFFPQVWFIDIEDITSENKTNQYLEIKKDNYVRMAFNASWNLTENITMHQHYNIETQGAVKDLIVYICNSSYGTGSPLTDVNCQNGPAVTGSEAYIFTIRNSSYLEKVVGINGKFGGVTISPQMFLVFTSQVTAVGKEYLIYFANNTVADNTNFNDTGTMWTTTDGGTTWVAYNATVDSWYSYAQADHNNITYYAYACDNSNNCVNSTFQVDPLDVNPNEPPSPPLILTPTDGEVINGTYNITWQTAGDPNLDAYNATVILLDFSGAVVATLADDNVTDDQTNLTFNTVAFNNALFQLNVTLCDIYDACSNTVTGYNFTISNSEPWINITSPLNETVTTASNVVNATSNETIHTWWYSVDGASNVTFTPGDSVVFAEGQRQLEVWGNRTSGVVGYDIQWFTVTTGACDPDAVAEAVWTYNIRGRRAMDLFYLMYQLIALVFNMVDDMFISLVI